MKLIRQHKRLEDIPQIQEQLEKIDFQQIRENFPTSKSSRCR